MTKYKFPRNSLLGFDDLFSALEGSTGINIGNYPPYDIVKICDSEKLEIRVALAGFTEQDIKITKENDSLFIESNYGQRYPVSGKEDYIHQGISKKSFRLKFTLAKNIKVKHATFTNGLLTVILDQEDCHSYETIPINIK